MTEGEQLTLDDAATADEAVTRPPQGSHVLLEAYQIACEHYGISHEGDKHLLRKLDGDRDHVHLAADLVMLEFLFGDHEDDLLAEGQVFYQLARLGAIGVLEQMDSEEAR